MGTISNSLFCHHHRPDDGNQQQQRCDLEGKHVIAIQKQRDALRVLGFRQLRNCSWEKPLPFCIDHYEKHTQCQRRRDRKSTRLNSSHANISYAVFCLKKKKKIKKTKINKKQ